jgi:hypothetical protein
MMSEWILKGRELADRGAIVLMLFAIPLAMYYLSGVVAGERGPYWLADNFDPAYAYLFNALNLINLRVPELVEHPGTTLHVLGAIVIKLLTLGKTSSEVTELVLSDPENFLSAISQTLRVLNLVSQIVLGVVCYFLTRSAVTAVLIQSPIVCFAYSFDTLSRVSPEPLLLLDVTMLACIVVLVIKRPTVLSEKALLCLLSIISGFGIATKLTFIPILCLPLVMLQSVRSRVLFLAGTLMAALVFTLPILPRYRVLLSWTGNLLIRSGNYGTGDTTIISNFWSNLADVLWYQPSMSCLIGVLAVACFVAQRQLGQDGCHQQESLLRVSRVALGLLIAQICQFVTVAKHPGSFAYLMPILGLSGLATALVYMILRELSLPSELVRSGIILLLVIGLFNSGNGQWQIVESSLEKYRERRMEAAGLERLRQYELSDCLQIFHYRASSIAYAEHFGAEWSGVKYYGPRIQSKYGSQTYFYQIWSKRLFSAGGVVVNLPEIVGQSGQSDGCIIFQGTPFEGDYERFRPPVQFQDRCDGKRETLYVIGRKCHRAVEAGVPS